MRLSRRIKFITTLTALLSLVFMQLAVAAYVCPTRGSEAALGSQLTHPIQGIMPGCKMDMTQAPLCEAHCQAENFSLDKPQLPQVSPFLAASLIELGDIPQSIVLHEMHPRLFRLGHSSAPPLSIQHCCFRI